jgi:hypothetical protein
MSHAGDRGWRLAPSNPPAPASSGSTTVPASPFYDAPSTRQSGKTSICAIARAHVRLRTGRPVSQYAGSEGCTGLAGTEPERRGGRGRRPSGRGAGIWSDREDASGVTAAGRQLARTGEAAVLLWRCSDLRRIGGVGAGRSHPTGRRHVLHRYRCFIEKRARSAKREEKAVTSGRSNEDPLTRNTWPRVQSG